MLLNNIFKFFKINTESPFFLTIDLGSETLKVLLNEVIVEDNEEKVRVKNVYKEFVSSDVSYYGKILDPSKLKDSLIKILNEIKKEMKGTPVSNVIITLSGNNCRSIMTTLQIDRPSSKSISEKENNEISQKVFEAAYKELSEIILDESGEENVEFELVDFIPIYMTSDGREVIDLIGEEGSEVQVCYSVFFGLSETINIYNKLLKGLGLNIVSFVSSNTAILKSLKTSKKDKIDCVILDIGGNTTEAIICFGGGVYLNKVLDMGGSDLTYELASKLNLSFLNAEKVKRLYTFNKLKEKESAVVQKVILFNLNNWLVGLEELFSDFNNVKVFPSDFYVLGGSSELPDITELLFEEPWTKSIPFKSLPEFKRIDFSSLKKLNKAQMARPSEDLIPILVSIEYLDKRKRR
jgi:cell division ATPase FtsA